ncbi:MAG: hypothetical protein EXX96DRAFT_520448 [Benjaminiella poitrasii]|nr:MAG: hypothetical protein EXX96DRAFT_520448 [Benjaminiella poitrasii]
MYPYIFYVDHTRPPFIDIKLPPAIVTPAYISFLLYVFVLGIDFLLLSNERHLQISPRRLRIVMTIVHVLIPLVFISPHPPCNVLFAAAPWFFAAYASHLPAEKMTIYDFIKSLFKIIIVPDSTMTQTQIRIKGLAKIALGVLKFAFMQLCVNPVLPHRTEYALEYTWLHPMSLLYTLLYGIKAYCLLGVVDVFMGLEQVVFGWNMVTLFNSPIISSSPRDFWSRRWNSVVHHLLHELVFMRNANTFQIPDSPIAKKISGHGMNVMDTISYFFTRTRQGRGLMAFIVSGVFHELIIMSTCRRMTLENLAFFTLQGLFVLLEVEFVSHVKGEGRKRQIACIALQLLQMSITGRLFLGPFLRYDFLPPLPLY